MASIGFKNNMELAELLKFQQAVQRRIHDQLEVQRRLQLQIEEQGRYLKMLYDKKKNIEGEMLKASTSSDSSYSTGFQGIRSKI